MATRKNLKSSSAFLLQSQSGGPGLPAAIIMYPVRPERNTSTFQPVYKGAVYPELLKDCILGSPTPLAKRECFTKAGGFDESLPSCQDWDMWLRIAKVCDFEFISEPLARHYVHGRQITTDLDAKIDARTRILRKHATDIGRYPRVHYAHLKRLAILYFLKGENSRGQRLLLQGVRTCPLQVTGYLHLLLSIVPPVHRRVLLRTNVVTVGDIIFYNNLGPTVAHEPAVFRNNSPLQSAQYLPETLMSIQQQTCSDWECIIITMGQLTVPGCRCVLYQER